MCETEEFYRQFRSSTPDERHRPETLASFLLTPGEIFRGARGYKDAENFPGRLRQLRLLGSRRLGLHPEEFPGASFPTPAGQQSHRFFYNQRSSRARRNAFVPLAVSDRKSVV